MLETDWLKQVVERAEKHSDNFYKLLKEYQKIL